MFAKPVPDVDVPDPAAMTKLADVGPAAVDDSELGTPELGRVTTLGLVTGVDTTTLELGSIEMLALVTGVDTAVLDPGDVEHGELTEDGAADTDPYGLVATPYGPCAASGCVAEAWVAVIAKSTKPDPARIALRSRRAKS